jgi:plastocyanin
LRGLALATLVAAVGLASIVPARAVIAVAGPEGEEAGFATPVVVVPKGQSLTFVNVDPASYNHNFVAYDAFFAGTATKPFWCVGYPAARCPRFWSRIIANGSTTPVEGVPALAAGQYTFVCSLHETMKGTLVVA